MIIIDGIRSILKECMRCVDLRMYLEFLEFYVGMCNQTQLETFVSEFFRSNFLKNLSFKPEQGFVISNISLGLLSRTTSFFCVFFWSEKRNQPFFGSF